MWPPCADESVQRVVTAVHRLSRRLNQWYDRQLADLSVSAGEWAVLSELVRNGETAALTPSQLAAATNIAPSSMTHRLDRMVERGLVSREPDPGNRTRVLVRFSDAGWELFAAAIKESNLMESDVVAGLTERQLQTLASLLERLIEGIDNAVE
ncbi:DNA-binding MarR family transcriptional regulator [Microlunatus panaciterrae]|uniref:DNA-binding MarR family transcriptional regulator n=1 Tax=Microlunatus panaciterrae TaxID=400768 RepID=A0ABS2RJ09_9ACTN|nr:MarR family winged helix-turn-helix transcriptional regulator [Microlunatus panaciterrae]MBM7798196.1 DNA-binding MarR family transcriptional regulator [Microlunatus panaciterrae]